MVLNKIAASLIIEFTSSLSSGSLCSLGCPHLITIRAIKQTKVNRGYEITKSTCVVEEQGEFFFP